MKPGEIIVQSTEIMINEGRENTKIKVKNSGDRPIQVGSHYHFFEANPALDFDREQAYGKHLDIPAGRLSALNQAMKKKSVSYVMRAIKKYTDSMVKWMGHLINHALQSRI